MMPHLILIALALTALIVALAGIYLYSADASRRSRAWRLIKLLFNR